MCVLLAPPSSFLLSNNSTNLRAEIQKVISNNKQILLQPWHFTNNKNEVTSCGMALKRLFSFSPFHTTKRANYNP